MFSVAPFLSCIVQDGRGCTDNLVIFTGSCLPLLPVYKYLRRADDGRVVTQLVSHEVIEVFQ